MTRADHGVRLDQPTPTHLHGDRPVAVEMRGITKRYGAVVACDDVDLVVNAGEIHGLLGQNGAGKSTLMKVLTGLVGPDAGSIHVAGRVATIDDPQRAAQLGIAMVHQHFSLVTALTVWENVCMGERGRIDRAGVIESLTAIGTRYGLEIDPFAKVGDLSTGQRQRVEIVKCLRREPNVIILDEPTSVLTMVESRELFRVLRHVVRDEGRAVVLISHKLDEIMHATDRVTVMRNGRVVKRLVTVDTEVRELAREMVGREVSLRSDDAAALGVALDSIVSVDAATIRADADRPVVLRIEGVTVHGADGRLLLDNCSLEVRSGEILGLAGVEGNGQAALGDVLSDLAEPASGTVHVGDERVPIGTPGAMLAAGVGVIPEDRHASGCSLEMSVSENLIVGDLDLVTRGRWFPLVDRRRVRRHVDRLVGEYGIKTASSEAPFGSLSGGNQQRVVLARELSRQPRVIVAAQPTRGLDVGGIEYVSEQLRLAAEAGAAVLLISTELEEILHLSHRLAVIHRGKIVGEMDRDQVDVEALGLLMGGQAA